MKTLIIFIGLVSIAYAGPCGIRTKENVVGKPYSHNPYIQYNVTTYDPYRYDPRFSRSEQPIDNRPKWLQPTPLFSKERKTYFRHSTHWFQFNEIINNGIEFELSIDEEQSEQSP